MRQGSARAWTPYQAISACRMAASLSESGGLIVSSIGAHDIPGYSDTMPRPLPTEDEARAILARRKTRPLPRPAPRVGRALEKLIRTLDDRYGRGADALEARWPEIVGVRHARVCTPESIRFPPGEKSEGIMQLVVLPAHAPIIQHVIPEIIERVNRFFGYNAVAQVKLRQGAVKASVARPAAVPPSLKPVPVELGESLRDIGDPELRAVLEGLARGLGADKD